MPDAISLPQLKSHLTGLGHLLDAWAAYSGMTEDALASQLIGAAQDELRRRSGIPYFYTRYCTRELAAQEGLTRGTDFDEYHDPMDYQRFAWRQNTGRLTMAMAPIASVAEIRFTLTANGQVLTVPPAWVNVKERQGVILIIPYGSGSVQYNTYLAFVGILSLNRASLGSGMVPGLVHVRYTAGLCARAEYDPTAPASDYELESAQAYQQAIGKLAASHLMRDAAGQMDRGGFGVGFDGMSVSVSPQVLESRAGGHEMAAYTWAERARLRWRGPLMGTV
jgi:hypothetical protein